MGRETRGKELSYSIGIFPCAPAMSLLAVFKKPDSWHHLQTSRMLDAVARLCWGKMLLQVEHIADLQRKVVVNPKDQPRLRAARQGPSQDRMRYLNITSYTWMDLIYPPCNEGNTRCVLV